jgi:hypothetical protein
MDTSAPRVAGACIEIGEADMWLRNGRYVIALRPDNFPCDTPDPASS